jgi:hypothetical protein
MGNITDMSVLDPFVTVNIVLTQVVRLAAPPDDRDDAIAGHHATAIAGTQML